MGVLDDDPAAEHLFRELASAHEGGIEVDGGPQSTNPDSLHPLRVERSQPIGQVHPELLGPA